MSTNRIILGLVIAAVASIAALTGWEAVSVGRVSQQTAMAQESGYYARADFAERHPELAKASVQVDTSDFSLRHPELSDASVPADISDFFLRHPNWVSTSQAVDTSDYALRHPELSGQ